MDKLHTQLTAEITVLSPLHVSTGRKLQKDFDWIERSGVVYVVNHDALFARVLERAEQDRGADVTEITDRLMSMTLTDLQDAGWLTPQDFSDRNSPLFHYTLHGRTHMKELSEQIKDVYGRPYLPGSSLKGALRTMLAVAIYTEQKRQPDLRSLKPSRSWAGQSLEKNIFGRDPNRDWLRALRVSDGPPLEPDCLQLTGVQVFPTARRGRPGGLDLDVEAIRPGTTFAAPIAIDEYGFREEIAPKLGWQGQRRWLGRLAQAGREHYRQRLLAEADYLNKKNAPRQTKLFYRKLIDEFPKLTANEFVLQIGWGAGWGSKTLDGLLKENDRAFARLVKDYRLQGRSRRPYQPGALFPASRKLVLRGDKTAEPLGWVKIAIQEV